MKRIGSLLLLLSPLMVHGADEKFVKERAAQLDRLAEALEKVKIDRTMPAIDREQDGRRYSKASELHLRFLTCVAGLEKEAGVVMFGIQTTGFTRQIEPDKEPTLKSGSSLVRVKVVIDRLLEEKAKPKAKADVPTIDHGSIYPAEQLARDEIHRLVKAYFPDVEIDGIQKFFRRRFAIQNDTDETVTAWLHYRTWLPGKDRGWMWKPGEPDDSRGLQVQIAAGKTELVREGSRRSDESEPIDANRVRIVLESESGRRWDEYADKSLWLVDKNPELDGERSYHARKIGVHTHRVKASKDPRVFVERVLAFRNETAEPVEISMRYRTRVDGAFRERKQTLTVPPRQTAQPRDDAGLRVRASRIAFTAESDLRKWRRHADEPLWLVDEANGRRSYRADRIGQFTYVLTPSDTPAQAGSLTVPQVNLQVGRDVVGTARSNQRLEVLEVRDDWVKVRTPPSDGAREGWVRRNNIRIDTPSPQPDSR